MYNFGGYPVTQLKLINFKNVFVYEIGLIATREVSPPFDEEQPYGRPYQPEHSPSIHRPTVLRTCGRRMG